METTIRTHLACKEADRDISAKTPDQPYILKLSRIPCYLHQIEAPDTVCRQEWFAKSRSLVPKQRAPVPHSTAVLSVVKLQQCLSAGKRICLLTNYLSSCFHIQAAITRCARRPREARHPLACDGPITLIRLLAQHLVSLPTAVFHDILAATTTYGMTRTKRLENH